ncbi:arginine exporter protein ArgO [Catenuloplanes nepalensis]|uniref:Arginine exporter protein ArgO n=1 Tax=Catenuloplanes nepalensis TaxID=587533 RepID=A0ABT9ML44_9ACTN|nr:LysE family transporter [Catenuloplanes nepalensis]MDP9792146.1 arginine exporter protein ArgO [Catenuloplanes nepalensis]
MSAAFLAGVVAGYGVAVPVGAIAILIAGLAARTSPRVGAAAALGVATADGLYAAVAVTGGSALAGVIAPVATPMRWIAAAVLIGLAVHTTITAIRHHRDPARAATTGTALTTPIRAYGGILALTLLNPMTIVYFGALVLAGQASGDLPPGAAAAFVLGAFLASASWQLLIAAGGSVVGRVLTSRRGRLLTALASAALVAALAAHTIVS